MLTKRVKKKKINKNKVKKKKNKGNESCAQIECEIESMERRGVGGATIY